MNNNNTDEAFVRLNHSLYHALLLSNFSIRELKTVMLILRLTIGCHKKWATLIQADLKIVGVSPSHAKEVLTKLLSKSILIRNEMTGAFRLNENYFELNELSSRKLLRLSHLIGKQLSRTSQNGNTVLPKSVTNDFPSKEDGSSQNGNIVQLPNTEDLSLDSDGFVLTKDNDKEKLKHSSKENISIHSYKKEQNKVDPRTFVPKTETMASALKAWEEIEPNHPDSFNFYLWSAHKGLPPYMFDEFTNQIMCQESNNPGAEFVIKVICYLSDNKLI